VPGPGAGEPMLTEAMTRAFMFADPSAAAEVNAVARQMERMFTRAMHEGEPSADDAAIAPAIGRAWVWALVGGGGRRGDHRRHRGRVSVNPGRVGDQRGFGGRREHPPRTRRPPAAALSLR